MVVGLDFSCCGIPGRRSSWAPALCRTSVSASNRRVVVVQISEPPTYEVWCILVRLGLVFIVLVARALLMFWSWLISVGAIVCIPSGFLLVLLVVVVVVLVAFWYGPKTVECTLSHPSLTVFLGKVLGTCRPGLSHTFHCSSSILIVIIVITTPWYNNSPIIIFIFISDYHCAAIYFLLILFYC